MKDLITEAITKRLSQALESTGGAKALYGEPITFNGEQIVPVARIVITLSAGAEGAGGGNAGITGGIASLAKGGGGGNAEAGVRIAIEPAGYLRATANGPQFVAIDPARG